VSLYGLCDHGNPGGSCLICDYAGAAARERSAFRNTIITAVAILILMLACFLHGCAGESGLYPDAGAASPAPDAAPAGDAGAPQCRDLVPGEEFFAGLGADAGALMLNQCGCTRVCRNTAGGQSCTAAAGELVDCAACQKDCAP
jgi:hypothetical protein